MKRVGMVILAVVLLAGAGMGVTWLLGNNGGTAQATSPTVDAGRAITVVGQGTARVAPDLAQVSIGVDTVADTVSEAVTESNTKIGAILAALKALGIAEKDIQTQNYSISVEQSSGPVTPEGSQTTAKPQYRVTNMVTVTIRDLTKVGSVLDAVVEAGANNIWGVSFTIEDDKAALTEARGKAVADAQARAQELAGLAGVQLGSIVSMSEVIGGGSYPVAVDRAFAMGGDSSSSVSVGEVEITYQVQVVFSLQQ